MKFLRNALAASALCALVFAGASVSVAQDKAPAKDLVLRGDAKCTTCHDEGDEPTAEAAFLGRKKQILAIGKTKHGTTADSRTPSCVNCHGESDKHVNHKGSAKPPQPDRNFSKKSTTPPQAQNQACLACHQGGKRTHWQMSLHASRDTTCTSCHQVHTAHDKVRDKKEQAEVCYACHKEQRAQVVRPSRHPIPEGKVTCSDCHNAHGSAGPKMMVRDNVNDTCYTCHMEKRGPFVRTHQPVQEDCSICHNPHGTTNPSLLKARSPYLCQECHEPTGHRGFPGAFASAGFGTTTANLLARGCMNCHTNIHGTNNPVNAVGERVFRR